MSQCPITRLKEICAFAGKAAMIYGLLGIVTGFLIFLFDMALAAFLQRFFMAAGLVSIGSRMPLGLALASPGIEAACLVGTGFFRAVIVWGNGYLNGLCQTAVETDKRRAIAAWAITSGKEEIGRVMTLYNDITIGAAASINNVFYVLSRLIMIGGLLAVMAWYSGMMTGFVIVLIILIAPLQIFIERIVSRNAKNIQQSLARSVSCLTSAVKNNLFIHLHDLVAIETAEIGKQVGVYGASTNSYYTLSSLRSVTPQLLGLIAICLIVLQGSVYFPGNQGNLVAYLYLVLRLFQTLADQARINGNLRLNAPRVRVLWEWWQKAQQTQVAAADAIAPLRVQAGWVARDLSFAYDDNHPVLRDLNFDITPGSLVLISGASGSGKSTLLHLLVGLLFPTRGSLAWYGKNTPPQAMTSRLPVRMAYVGAEPFLVAGSIRAQLLLGQDTVLSDADLTVALQAAHADFVFALPHGLDSLITEQGGGLSAGQKQRLSLARALLRRPSVLMLDEATANLDTETESAVFDSVEKLRGQMTILVISHRPPKNLIPDQIISFSSNASDVQ